MKKSFTIFAACAAILLLTIAPGLQPKVLAQTGQSQSTPLAQVLDRVRVQYQVNLLFETKVIAGKTTKYVVPATGNAEQVLRELLSPLSLKVVKIDDKNYAIIAVEEVVVAEKKTTQPAPVQVPNSGAGSGQTTGGIVTVNGTREVKGKVLSAEDGTPLAKASVFIKGTKVGVVADKDGAFAFEAPENATTLVVNFVGYKTVELPIAGKDNFVVRLEASVAVGSDVVVMGIMNRKKESFTGATSSFTAEELKVVGNQNIIEGLRALDPSFIVNENNQMGSNPNVLPEIEIRGKTSIDTKALRDEFSTDPNQPLFILDGFETNLRTIVDLDMNRVESITLLKDAASTAIYGARAANGVVVVETRKPKPGAMQLYYNGDFKIEAPDLSGYNLMNAEEKLEFERLSGRYVIYSPTLHQQQFELDALYNSRLTRVRRGVDTYWMNEPLQNGYAAGHSLRAEGGDSKVRYGAGLQYRDQKGVMKGNERQSWGSNFDIIFRSGKVNVMNKMFVNGFTSQESPYGSFRNFAQANPYYEKYNADGGVDKYLEEAMGRSLSTERVVNPLYDAQLNQENSTKNFAFQNNLQITYSFTNALQLQGGIQLNKGTNTYFNFTPPENSKFDNATLFEKGSYVQRQWDNFGYQTFGMLTYGKLLGGKHQINSNLRAEWQESRNESYQTTAVGFPAGSNGNPAFSYGYDPTGRPVTASSVFRRTSFLASGSYTYDRRFVADFSLRMDGSTAFGVNNKYQPFWSAGLAWNLHQEKWMKNAGWVNSLRVKANTGIMGNQSFGTITSVSVYNYLTNLNGFGQGISLTTLGNPNLEWQNTKQTNIGADFALFKNRFSGFVNFYRKYTEPLIVAIDLPASTGLNGYPTNVGNLTNDGVEVNLRYAIISKPSKRTNWTVGVTGLHQKATYAGLSNILDNLNKAQQDNLSLQRYKDGFSPDDLWAVRSMGIDPANGREVFQRLDGQYTYDYDPSQVRVEGNSRPLGEGTFNTSVTIKGFSFSAFLRFRFGGDVFNYALYNKVENISDGSLMYNQDKRALTDRWKKPGDVARFKNIGIVGISGLYGQSATGISSRFIQEENTIAGESISAGYDFDGHKWIRKLGMKTLRLRAYMNDFFRVSTIQKERGIEFPFTRSVSFSINTSF